MWAFKFGIAQMVFNANLRVIRSTANYGWAKVIVFLDDDVLAIVELTHHYKILREIGRDDWITTRKG